MKKVVAILTAIVLAGIVGWCTYGLYQTMPVAHEGENAAVYAAILGGLIGAAGAAIAVYLTLSAQRHEDRERIQSAIKREVIEFCRLISGHMQTCENIRSGLISVPGAVLPTMTALPEPIIYPAVADKVGLLPSPQNVVAFYMRIHEIKFLIVPAIMSHPLIARNILKADDIRALVGAFIDILVFADGILNGSQHNGDFDAAVLTHTRSDNARSIDDARTKFGIAAEEK